MARVLVTGAAGFIGRHLVPVLIAHGHDVIAVSRTPDVAESRKGARWLVCDLLSESAPAELIETYRPTHLIHLAWNTTPGSFWNDLANVDWLAASLRLYRVFASCGGRRAIGSGTCAEYDWNEPVLSEAKTPIKPRTLYGSAKAALGSTLTLAATEQGLSFAWGRLFFIYGPGEKRGRLVSDVFSALMDGQPALVSHCHQERDVMHVSDVAGALVALLESDVAGPVNIATGECHPLADIVTAVARLAGRPELIQFDAVPVPPDEPRRLAATITRLREEVGFIPKFDLQSGIEDTYHWWCNHHKRVHPMTPKRVHVKRGISAQPDDDP